MPSVGAPYWDRFSPILLSERRGLIFLILAGDYYADFLLFFSCRIL